MCMVKQKEDGSFVQICNCKNGSGNCENNNCVVGYTKNLLNTYLDNKDEFVKMKDFSNFNLNKNFDHQKLKTTLKLIVKFLSEEHNEEVDFMRKLIEYLLYKTFIQDFINFDQYKKSMHSIDNELLKP